jgi:hypothetical protein
MATRGDGGAAKVFPSRIAGFDYDALEDWEVPPPVVFDRGSWRSRIGLAGDDQPLLERRSEAAGNAAETAISLLSAAHPGILPSEHPFFLVGSPFATRQEREESVSAAFEVLQTARYRAVSSAVCATAAAAARSSSSGGTLEDWAVHR